MQTHIIRIQSNYMLHKSRICNAVPTFVLYDEYTDESNTLQYYFKTVPDKKELQQIGILELKFKVMPIARMAELSNL